MEKTTLFLKGGRVASFASHKELVGSGSKKRRSERRPRITVSVESTVWDMSDAVEKLSELGESVKKESGV